MNKKQEIIRGHLTCACSEFYKSRNRKDPTCFRCGYETEIELMMDELLHAFVDWHNTSDDSKIVQYIPNSEIGKFNLETENLNEPQLDIDAAKYSLLLTNQKLWDMSKVIINKQKAAKEQPTHSVDWDMLQEMWFDWLKEELFGNNT